MGSILGQDPSSTQVAVKSLQQFLSSPADNKTDTGQHITTLVEVMSIYLEKNNNVYPFEH